ncbi:ribonucleotide reductase small subunit, putative [Plasmodium gallinaceum]|uniref:Ribonucleotide reductase small subunit, putative n=1 Tax=Plasmodium gallinaceum TaxID=5849 RepID=A0A1J1GSC6_PLAGA|nr:ribonucleotide reductase small subunit, putative [Plasmodium gallinaceum]CRG94216.1 ribonucleotide reductase small subunit, putative [Plasmodium gallinaceum]
MSKEYFHDQETLLEAQNNDDILTENKFRWVMFPIKYKTFWNYYKEIESLFWTAEDYNFDKDKQYLENIDKNMLIKLYELVCFYSLKDLHIYEEQALITSKMLDIIQIPEGRAFYGFQMCMENIHDEVYACIFETYIPDQKQKTVIINKVIQLDSVLKKQKWLTEIFETNIPFFNKLILLYISKVLFNGTLNILIGYCKENSILPCLCSVHEKIHRDEYLHGDFSVMCCNHLNNKLKYEHVLEYFKMAVELEYQFALEMLELNVLKIKKEQVRSFLEYLADTMLVNLKYPKHYNSKYPFLWPEIDKIVVNENHKTESVKKSDNIYGEKQILFDEDF